MKVRYLGSPYGSVRGGGALFNEAGDEADVDDSWGRKMITTDQFEAAGQAGAKKKTAKAAETKDDS